MIVDKHMKETLNLYWKNNIRPGSFTYALLCNDLFQAVENADVLNRYRITDIVKYILRYGPIGSYGSPEIVESWIKQGKNA